MGETEKARGSSAVQLALLFSAFFGAAILATQPLVLNPSGYLPANADALLNSFVLKRVCESALTPLDAMRGGMFHPDSGSLYYSEHLAGLAIQALPLCALQVDHVALFNLSYWLTLAIGAMGAWLLAKEITGSAAGALVAAVVFSFTSANYDSAARIQIVASQWTPICLLFLIRFSRKGRARDALWMGVSFAMQALSCVYYEILLAILLILSVPWWVKVAGGFGEARKRIPGALLAAGVAAVLVLPLNLGQRAHLAPVLSARPEARPVDWSFFSTVLPGNFLYGGWLGRDGVVYDGLFFPGFLPVLLALVFVVLAVRRRDWRLGYPNVGPVLVIGALAFALSVGSKIVTPLGEFPGPITVFSRWIPGLEQVRVPARFLMFTRLSLAVVAACVVAQMLRRTSVQAGRAIAMLIAVVCFVEHWSPSLEVWAVPKRSDLPPVYEWLEREGASLGPILEFPPSLLRLRREEGQWLHLAAFHGRPIANGYSSFRPAWFEFFMETAFQPGDRWVQVMSALGVRTVVVHPKSDGLPESDRATAELVDYAERHPEALMQIASFTDRGSLGGRWSQLGGERVFSLFAPPRLPRKPGPGATLDRTGWSCRGSAGSCELAIDGNPATQMGGPDRQSKGDFLKVRFAEPAMVDAVSIDLGQVAEMYPRDAVIRLLQEGAWVEVDAELDVDRFLSDLLGGSMNPTMVWRFKPARAEGIELRLAAGGQGFRPLGIPEIYAHAPLSAKVVAENPD